MVLSKKYTEEEKQKYVEEFKKGTQFVYEFAEQRGILASEFRSWLRKDTELQKLKKQQESIYNNQLQQTFGVINFNVVEPSSTNSKGFKFENETIKLELKAGYDKNMLQKLLETNY